jgi:hypothetical protein
MVTTRILQRNDRATKVWKTPIEIGCSDDDLRTATLPRDNSQQGQRVLTVRGNYRAHFVVSRNGDRPTSPSKPTLYALQVASYEQATSQSRWPVEKGAEGVVDCQAHFFTMYTVASHAHKQHSIQSSGEWKTALHCVRSQFLHLASGFIELDLFALCYVL